MPKVKKPGMKVVKTRSCAGGDAAQASSSKGQEGHKRRDRDGGENAPGGGVDGGGHNKRPKRDDKRGEDEGSNSSHPDSGKAEVPMKEVSYWVKMVLGGNQDIPVQRVTRIFENCMYVADLLEYLIEGCKKTKSRLGRIDPPDRLILCAPTEEEKGKLGKDPPEDQLPSRLGGMENIREKMFRGDRLLDSLGEVGQSGTCPLLVVDTSPGNTLHSLQKSQSHSGSGSGSEKTSLVKEELFPLADVVPEPVPGNAPPFTAEDGWLKGTVGQILKEYGTEDSSSYRVPPMALVRCSRGGKTRALQEVGAALKGQGIPVVSITLNDYSSVTRDDASSPVNAICRRIAFSAWRERDNIPDGTNWKGLYKSFAKKHDVGEDLIVEWLGEGACVLLVDELNNLPKAEELSIFLKDNFLSPMNRYLVFSSHVLSTTTELVSFMETSSSRQVILRPLPLIPSLHAAKHNLGWPTLNSREALYYGLIPALIHESGAEQSAGLFGQTRLPSMKREEAIKACLDQGLVSEDSIRRLLGSLVSGDAGAVLLPLQQLMSTGFDERTRHRVQWIPFHMMEVLATFAERHGQQSYSASVRKVPELFDKFRDEKRGSGEGWECLFIIVTLCRCLSGLFENTILPISHPGPYSVTFNTPWDSTVEFETHEVATFLKGMKKPDHFPHVAIYYPSNARFELYDVIVAVYDHPDNRCLYGYQLKEGKEMPKKVVIPDFHGSYVIRGKAAQIDGMKKGWVTPREKSIRTFFGSSGQHWTPQRWSELEAQSQA